MDVETQDYNYIVMIHEYMNLDKKISGKIMKIRNLKIGFYSQNFHGRTDYDDPLGIQSTGFNVKNNVTQYLDRIAKQQEGIAILRRKQAYFTAYMNSLSPDVKNGLERDFKNDTVEMYNITLTNTHKKVIAEIAEIEEAICHEFNKELFPEYDKDIIALETGELSNDTIEDSFQSMLNVLGVT